MVEYDDLFLKNSPTPLSSSLKSLFSPRRFFRALLYLLYSSSYLFPSLNSLNEKYRLAFIDRFDLIRYGTIWLALERIIENNIEGDLAEVGVWKGNSSAFIHEILPNRKIYLFDTFEGFPTQDVEKDALKGYPTNFSDTSIDEVINKMKKKENVIIRKGYFPETAKGLENKKFSFVSLDADLYNPIKAGLYFFYPRLSKGGYIFVHDYNYPLFNRGPKRAVDEFCSDLCVNFFEIPDACGSIIIKKP